MVFSLLDKIKCLTIAVHGHMHKSCTWVGNRISKASE